ncbi:MAG TPA: pyridoxal phosphate-dependent aminotransferase [Candidatus Krumholzibacteria bacterium]|nr:pyridoxal phosphate-dependent aminotransferase [Candidatus Krumholzibacteria bacterium]
MKFAERMSHLGTETAFEVLARARALEAQGREIVHLEIGEPDFDTPENIKQAAVRALQDGYTHYGPSAGLPAFREAIAEYINNDRGIDVDPAQVVVTPGAKPIIFFTAMALLDPGDEVIYPNPGFPIYESMIDYLGAKRVPLPLLEENKFAFDPAHLEKLITRKTKLVVINSPQNPTGGILPRGTIARLCELAVEHDFFVLSDEIYSRIIYDGDHVTPYSFPGMPERTVILDGHSKTYAMTGWRLGYGIFPKQLAPKIAKLQTNATSCTCSFTQMAGLEALRGPQDAVDAMVAEFRARRDLIVDGLNGIPGFSCHRPSGAFYVFPNIKQTGMTAKQMEDHLMDKAGVAVLAGTAFGVHGEGYIRLSYANSQENIRKAIGQIAQSLPGR